MNPFDVLGVSPGSSPEVIRSAWRQLAKESHPDAGGDEVGMVRLNEALALALADVNINPADTQNWGTVQPSTPRLHTTEEKIHRMRHDVSSFTLNVLPVESFEFLEIVANISGSLIETDCPYLVEFSLENLGDDFSLADWCRCELVPEAGGTMVHLTVGGLGVNSSLDVEVIRDQLIRCINEIGQVSHEERKLS